MRRISIAFSVAAAIAVASCKATGDSGTTTYSISFNQAPPVTAVAGAQIPISVTVMSQHDNDSPVPAAGVSATLTVTGGGSVTPSTVIMGSDGTGAATWTLGTAPQVQTLRVTVSASAFLDVSVVATAVATQLAIISEPGDTAISGDAITTPPAIQLRDAGGAAVAQAGVTITAAVESGNATLTGTTAVTDATGLATFTALTLTGDPGQVSLRFSATLNGSTAAVTSHPITLTEPMVALVAPPSSSEVSGLPLFEQPAVQLQDAAGAPLRRGGVTVTASVASGSAVLGIATGSSATLFAVTDTSGTVTFHDLALTGSGTTTLQFAATGFIPVTSGPIAVGAGNVITLTNGAIVGPSTAAAGSLTYYTFVAPAGTDSLDAEVFGGDGSSELYLRRGAVPTASDYDCHQAQAGASQICIVPSATAGTYYALVRADAALDFSHVAARAYTAACALKGTITLGVPVTGTLNDSASCQAEVAHRAFDRYALDVAATQAVQITGSITSGSGSLSVVVDPLVGEAGEYDGNNAAVNSGVVILGPGHYEIQPEDQYGSNQPNSYAVTVAPASLTGNGCVLLAAIGALPFTAPMALQNSDCAGITPGTFSTRLAVLLSPGQTVTITAASSAFDPLLRLLAGETTSTGTVLATDDNGGGGTTAKLVYQNTTQAEAAYTVEITSTTPAATGGYTLTYAFGPGFYDRRVRPLPGALSPEP